MSDSNSDNSSSGQTLAPEDVEVDDEKIYLRCRRSSPRTVRADGRDEAIPVHSIRRGGWQIAFIELGGDQGDLADQLVENDNQFKKWSAEELRETLAGAPDPLYVRFDSPKAARKAAHASKYATLVGTADDVNTNTNDQ